MGLMLRWLWLACLVGCGASQGEATQPLEAQPSWLAGTWRSEEANGGLYELWGQDPSGGALGLNVRVDESGVPATAELMWLEPGARALVAMPGGRRTRFATTRAAAGELRFEAPEHDSPKWIRYQRTADTLEASIGDHVEPQATWTFERVGDGPRVDRLAFDVCRNGDTIQLTQDGCFCGAQLTCGVVDDPLPLRAAILDTSCDACVPATGECAYDGALALDDGECARREAVTLQYVDLR